LNDENKRKQLIAKGKVRLKQLQENSILHVIENILNEYAIKLKCWKD